MQLLFILVCIWLIADILLKCWILAGVIEKQLKQNRAFTTINLLGSKDKVRREAVKKVKDEG